MKIAVTGATGFVGRHLAREVEARGHVLYELSRAAQPDAGVRRFDLTDSSSFDSAVDGVDVVVHAAAHLPASYIDSGAARTCMDRNALATLELLEACVRRGVKKLVYLSTNVYAKGSGPLAEDAPTYPADHATYYYASKLCGEIWVEHFRRSGKLATASLRLASVIGPGLTRGVVSTFYDALTAGRPIDVADGGRFRSDLVDVADVASAAVAAAERASQGIFNIGSGTTSSILEIAESLAKLIQAPTELIRVAPAGNTPPPAHTSFNVARARADLDYAPRPLADTLGAYVAWRREART